MPTMWRPPKLMSRGELLMWSSTILEPVYTSGSICPSSSTLTGPSSCAVQCDPMPKKVRPTKLVMRSACLPVAPYLRIFSGRHTRGMSAGSGRREGVAGARGCAALAAAAVAAAAAARAGDLGGLPAGAAGAALGSALTSAALFRADTRIERRPESTPPSSGISALTAALTLLLVVSPDAFLALGRVSAPSAAATAPPSTCTPVTAP
mmetsp:Transcript_16483/g.41113  ORF Transcript_16483/g.41113 Transcript_16483/m.41113 type:complete len:207 (-) Transcript_16483:1197-1817(-)